MIDSLQFWKTCCERGISICRVPKPFREEVACWLVEKTKTFADRKTWNASHTFDSDEEMVAAVEEYFVTGVEPRNRVT